MIIYSKKYIIYNCIKPEHFDQGKKGVRVTFTVLDVYDEIILCISYIHVSLQPDYSRCRGQFPYVIGWKEEIAEYALHKACIRKSFIRYAYVGMINSQ